MMNTDPAAEDSASLDAKPAAAAWSVQIERLQALSRAGGLDTLRGFPSETERRYQEERTGFVRSMLRISMVFALLSYPLYLEFDRLTVCALCQPWIYWLAFGIATPAHLIVLGLSLLPRKGPRFYQLAGLVVVVANTITLVLSSALGTLLKVPVPFEVMMLQILYVFFLLGFSFRLALPCAVAILLLYASVNALAGLESEHLIRNGYFLISLAAMCTVGCGLAEIADRRAWLSSQMLQGFSERDGLTGLFHRGAFETRATMTLRVAQRDRMSVTLAVFDLDHFKQLNDRLGHLEGDRCLRRVANLLATEPPLRRPLDFSTRLGGEEFGIVWFGADPEWVSRTLQGLVTQLRALGIANPGAPTGVLTTSVGVAHYDGLEDITLDTLLQQADAALYEAKHQGRNQIRVYAAPAAEAA